MTAAVTLLSLENLARKYAAELRDASPLLFRTGLETVDAMLAGGLACGEMAVVGARPSHGKTMFALQWCYAVAEQGFPCLLISEEMTGSLLAQRAARFASEVDERDFRRDHEQVFLDVAAFFKARRPILVAENCRTADRAQQAIAEAKTHHGVRFVVVDYCQLLRGKGMTKYEQVSDVSMALKAAAVENEVACVVLAQLSRECEKQSQFKPRLHDLRDSGQIEQDADVVMFLVWPWKISSTNQPQEYVIYGAKNRNRGIRGDGCVKLRFDPERQRLHETRESCRSQGIAPVDEALEAYNGDPF